MTESLFDLPSDDPAPPSTGSIYDGTAATRGVSEISFPLRVAVLLRSRPIAAAAESASRQDCPPDIYDISTPSLAAIDLIFSQQGFEHEALALLLSRHQADAGLQDDLNALTGETTGDL